MFSFYKHNRFHLIYHYKKSYSNEKLDWIILIEKLSIHTEIQIQKIEWLTYTFHIHMQIKVI
jgi:hypothetical protein